MNICIVNPGDVSQPRGGENRVLAISSALANGGYHVHLVLPKLRGQLPEILRCPNIKVHTVNVNTIGGSINDQFKRAINLIKVAKKVTKRWDAILQIEHSPLAGFAYWVGVRDYIVDMHDLAVEDPTYHNLPFRKAIFNILESRALLNSIATIVVSRFMKRYISTVWGIPDNNIHIIENGYFKHKVKYFSKFKRNYNSKQYNIIMFLGTLHLKLDLNKIIHIAKYFNNSLVYVIGDGPARGKLERLVRLHRIKNIIITGWLPDKKMYKIMNQSDVCILPETDSIHVRASCPVKLFEYGAFGKAIVADDVTEVCKMFKEHNAALLSQPNDIDTFIRNINLILSNQSLKKKLGHNAFKLVSNHSWEDLSSTILKVYDTIALERDK